MKATCFLSLIVLGLTVQNLQAQGYVLYLNNVNGYIEPCFCPENPYGGLMYVVGVVDQLRQKQKDVIMLDSGDLLPNVNWRTKAEFAVEFYNLLKVNALNAGDQEFFFGRDYLHDLTRKMNFPVLSANITGKGQRLFTPFLMQSLGQMTIGIIGIVDPQVFQGVAAGKIAGATIQPVDDVLPAQLAEWKGKADVLLLLSHCGLSQDLILAQKYPELDIIIGAHSCDLLEQPMIQGNTKIYQAGKFAHHLGVIEIIGKAEGKVVSKDSLISLESVAVTQAASELYQKYQASSDERMNAVLDSAYQAKTTEQEKRLPSADYCGQCHFEEYLHWSKTAHAFAWVALEKEGKAEVRECVACHATAVNKERGFENMAQTPELINVGCISCHTDFVDHPEPKKKPAPVAEETCVQCHDEKNSPDFNHDSYKKAILHVSHYYTVKPNDCLSEISLKKYGSGYLWPSIFRVNKELVNNENLILPGQKLFIPQRPAEKLRRLR